MPKGYYVDVTAFLAAKNFNRIAAHDDYKTNSKGLEWWHFHYTVDLQETFLDELEQIGIAEDALLKAGWSLVEMDRKPG